MALGEPLAAGQGPASVVTGESLATASTTGRLSRSAVEAAAASLWPFMPPEDDEAKKAIGPFKRQMWSLDDERRRAIGQTLEEQFSFLMGQLNIGGTASAVAKFVTVTPIPLKLGFVTFWNCL